MLLKVERSTLDTRSHKVLPFECSASADQVLCLWLKSLIQVLYSFSFPCMVLNRAAAAPRSPPASSPCAWAFYSITRKELMILSSQLLGLKTVPDNLDVVTPLSNAVEKCR
jgi:hypothetical protein